MSNLVFFVTLMLVFLVFCIFAFVNFVNRPMPEEPYYEMPSGSFTMQDLHLIQEARRNAYPEDDRPPSPETKYGPLIDGL